MDIYLFQYHHNGSDWILEIHADDAEDAKARVRKMPLATYLGKCEAKIPAGLGWFAKLFVAWKNFWRDR